MFTRIEHWNDHQQNTADFNRRLHTNREEYESLVIFASLQNPLTIEQCSLLPSMQHNSLIQGKTYLWCPPILASLYIHQYGAIIYSKNKNRVQRAICNWKKTIEAVSHQMCNNQTLDYSEDIHILCSLDGMAPSPSKERKPVYEIGRLVYTTWQRNRIKHSELNEIDGISSPKRAFHRLCSSNRVHLFLRLGDYCWEYRVCASHEG